MSRVLASAAVVLLCTAGTALRRSGARERSCRARRSAACALGTRQSRSGDARPSSTGLRGCERTTMYSRIGRSSGAGSRSSSPRDACPRCTHSGSRPPGARRRSAARRAEAEVTSAAGAHPRGCTATALSFADGRAARTRTTVDGKLWGSDCSAPAEPCLDDRAGGRRAAHSGSRGRERTPVFTSRTARRLVGASVHVKAECFQRGGAFKFRGASTRSPRCRASRSPRRLRVLVRQSCAGRRIAAQLMARTRRPHAGRRAGRKAWTQRGLQAGDVMYDRWSESREELGARLAEERGLRTRRPYDDPLVMRDRGRRRSSCSRLPSTRVAGGGLIAGCATAAKALRPGIRVVGVAGDGRRHGPIPRCGQARAPRRAAHDR